MRRWPVLSFKAGLEEKNMRRHNLLSLISGRRKKSTSSKNLVGSYGSGSGPDRIFPDYIAYSNLTEHHRSKELEAVEWEIVRSGSCGYRHH